MNHETMYKEMKERLNALEISEDTEKEAVNFIDSFLTANPMSGNTTSDIMLFGIACYDAGAKAAGSNSLATELLKEMKQKATRYKIGFICAASCFILATVAFFLK